MNTVALLNYRGDDRACWAVCCAILYNWHLYGTNLSRRGRWLSAEKVRHHLFVTKDRKSYPTFSALNQMGLFQEEIPLISISQIEKFIIKQLCSNCPVAISTTNAKGVSHAALIIGFDQEESEAKVSEASCMASTFFYVRDELKKMNKHLGDSKEGLYRKVYLYMSIKAGKSVRDKPEYIFCFCDNEDNKVFINRMAVTKKSLVRVQ
ncbi:hypothetical protein DC094_07015 [Pelagibaculum spongiae]|uniref:Uncharacterized protein n=2 Tax=Pelagibaculum spongiae TaxID=2080658 RepID=A0A2V1H2V4_9GAMM|nr:hypothetical protein DC094_07015 [Pelagibaculum spongiae]